MEKHDTPACVLSKSSIAMAHKTQVGGITYIIGKAWHPACVLSKSRGSKM